MNNLQSTLIVLLIVSAISAPPNPACFDIGKVKEYKGLKKEGTSTLYEIDCPYIQDADLWNWLNKRAPTMKWGTLMHQCWASIWLRRTILLSIVNLLRMHKPYVRKGADSWERCLERMNFPSITRSMKCWRDLKRKFSTNWGSVGTDCLGSCLKR